MHEQISRRLCCVSGLLKLDRAEARRFNCFRELVYSLGNLENSVFDCLEHFFLCHGADSLPLPPICLERLGP